LEYRNVKTIQQQKIVPLPLKKWRFSHLIDSTTAYNSARLREICQPALIEGVLREGVTVRVFRVP